MMPYTSAAYICLTLASFAVVPGARAAESRFAAYQGTWLEQSLPCDSVYAGDGKGKAFKKPLNIFAPAFMISGNRLQTPQATCRMRSVKPAGERQYLTLSCANSVATNDVTVLLSTPSDNLLKRYFNEDDATGNIYRRCDR